MKFPVLLISLFLGFASLNLKSANIPGGGPGEQLEDFVDSEEYYYVLSSKYYEDEVARISQFGKDGKRNWEVGISEMWFSHIFEFGHNILALRGFRNGQILTSLISIKGQVVKSDTIQGFQFISGREISNSNFGIVALDLSSNKVVDIRVGNDLTILSIADRSKFPEGKWSILEYESNGYLAYDFSDEVSKAELKIRRVSENGNVLWDKILKWGLLGTHVLATSGGGAMIFGMQNVEGKKQFVCSLIDRTGILQWENVFDDTNIEYVSSGTQLPSGNFIFVDEAYENTDGYNGIKILVISRDGDILLDRYYDFRGIQIYESSIFVCPLGKVYVAANWYGENKHIPSGFQALSHWKSSECFLGEIVDFPQGINQVNSLLADERNVLERSIPIAEENNDAGFAIVIGNRNYEKISSVDFAFRDAQTIKKYLVDAMGYLPHRVLLLEDLRKSEFEKYFGTTDYPGGSLANIVDSSSELFVYYSGHGAPDIEGTTGYLLPIEYEPNNVQTQGYSVSQLLRSINHLSTKSNTLVIDACFTSDKVYSNISSNFHYTPPAVDNEKLIVFWGASKGQVATWFPAQKHGLFTYLFLKAIQDGNADSNTDGMITYEEVFKYLKNPQTGVAKLAQLINNTSQNPGISGGRSYEEVMVRLAK